MSSNIPLVEFQQVSRSFGNLRANQGLSFSVQSNTIHALVGENGAGKSTAMKILFGLLTPDSGQILLRGEPVEIPNPIRARQLGIGMVQQHFVLAPEHTALDNILFSETSKPFQWLQRSSKKLEYTQLAKQYGFEIQWDKPVGELSVGEQQRIEILKVLRQNAEILILDEPTAVLTPQEVKEFFKNLQLLKAQGKTIILITHKLKEVMAVTDAMTVLRQCQVVAELKTGETNEDQVAELMVGRRIKWSRRDLKINQMQITEPVLELRGTSRLDFRIDPQEILGIAGVEGHGQSELIERILNPQTFPEFEMHINGRPAQGLMTSQVRKLSAGIFPEDRLRLGSVPSASVKENFILGYDWDLEFSNSGWLKWPEIKQITQKNLERFDVRPAQADATFGSFSGGNQQKIVVARELRKRPQFILAAQPTRGVDVGAIEFIHEQILQAQERGAGILLISTELDELLKLSTRILVLYKNKFVLDIPRSEFNELVIGRAMGGVHP